MFKFFFNTTKSLRVRFALGFSLLVTVFLAVALVFIYYSLADFRKDEFYNRLRDRAMTTFKLLVEVERIDRDLLQLIDKNTLNSLYDEKVLIFKDSTLIYSSIDDRKIENLPELFSGAKKNKEYRTSQNHAEVVALHLEQGGIGYTILASAYDKYGRNELTFLKLVVLTVYFAVLAIIWLCTYFFVKKIMHPLEKLKTNLANVNYNNLDFRLRETGQGEEVDSLSATFNQMLYRLQEAFDFQKDFIHYASHELRTPLAAMVSITENSMKKPLSNEQMKNILGVLYNQQKNLANITNSLIVLSDNKNNSHALAYPKIRLDELLFKSVEIIKNIHPEAEIEINLEGELLNENALLINANEPLMLVAFNNLVQNAHQYSKNGKVTIVVSSTGLNKEIRILNPGNPFGQDEKEKIFTPFYRASNTGIVKGHGLGLPLVKQIIQLHKAEITYSYINDFNEFKITFSS